MAPGDKPASGPQQNPDPVDRTLDELKADEVIPHDQLFRMLEQLHGEVREGNIRSSKDKLQKLRDEATKELKSDVERTGKEFQDSALRDLNARLALVEAAAREVNTSAGKSGFKEGPDKTLNKVGELARDLGAVLDQIKESIASSIGAHIDTLKPFIGEDMGTMLEKFIGDDRIRLGKALAAAKISLPMESFIHARKAIDKVRVETNANSKGWNAERMAFFVVQKLSSAGITGKEDKGILEQKITDATNALTEITKSPVTGTKVDFVDVPNPPILRMNDTIAGKNVIVQSDGGITVAGQKWKMERGGAKLAVRTSEFTDGKFVITDDTYQTIALSENLNAIIEDLASTDAAKQKISPKNPQGVTLVDFVRG